MLEHGQGDYGVFAVEAVGLAGEQADPGVRRLDTAVGLPELDARRDAVAVLGDRMGQGDKPPICQCRAQTIHPSIHRSRCRMTWGPESDGNGVWADPRRRVRPPMTVRQEKV